MRVESLEFSLVPPASITPFIIDTTLEVQRIKLIPTFTSGHLN